MEIIGKLITWSIYGIFGYFVLMMFVIGPIYSLFLSFLEKYFPKTYINFKRNSYKGYCKNSTYPTKVVNKVSESNYGADNRSDNKKHQYHFFSGLLSGNFWIICICLSIGNFYLYSKEEGRLEKRHEQAVYSYDRAMRERDYMQSQLARGGTICNDGWKSSSSGQGTCSHHGGIDRSISDSRYYFLSSQAKRYEEEKSPYWLDLKVDRLQEKHYWAEFFIVAGLLWLYMFMKKQE